MLKNRIDRLRLLLFDRSEHSGNQGVIVMGGFLLAVTLWFLVTLNQEYETEIYYPVKVEAVPDNVQLGELDPVDIRLRVKGSGVDLLEEHLRWKRDTVKFAYNNDFRKGYLLTNSNVNEFAEYLRTGLNPQRVSPDSIFFGIDDKVPKKVPLIHQVKIQLEPAYQLEEEIKLIPDSVTVMGPKAMLDTLKAWYTDKWETEKLSRPVSIQVPILDTFAGLTVNPQEAMLQVRPRLYTEIRLDLPIRVSNLPAGVKVRFQTDRVMMTCLVPMDRYDEFRNKPYRIELNYENIDPQVPYVIPDTGFLPDPIRVVSWKPQYISYVIVHENFKAL